MLWSGPRSLSSGAVALEERGENRTYVPGGRAWDAKMAPTSCLLEAFRIGIIPPFFPLEITMASLMGGSLREKHKKKHIVTSAFQSRTRHVVALGTITPSLVVSSPIANSASFRLFTHTPRLPTHTFIPTVAFSSLQVAAAAVAVVADAVACCCRRAGPLPWCCRCSKPQVIRPACTLYPIW